MMLMDFTIYDLLGEAATVGHFTHGAITYRDLRELRWLEYDGLVIAAKEALQKPEDADGR